MYVFFFFMSLPTFYRVLYTITKSGEVEELESGVVVGAAVKADGK